MFIDHQHEIHFHNVIKCYTQKRQEIIIMQLILGVAFTYGAPYFDLADCVLQARLTDVLKTLSCVIFFRLYVDDLYWRFKISSSLF